MPKFVLSLAALLPILFSGTALAAPDAVASTKPIHSLVSAVMGDLGTPRLIVRGAASPHTYSLRPSDAAALENADIVFWTGHGLELFLAKALDSLALKAEVVELAKAPGIVLLPLRQGGAFEAHAHDEADHDHEGHDHDHDHDGHDHDSHGDGDMHFWLDPENAGLMVSHIADILAAADPDNADAYRANAEAELQRLDALTAELQVKLAPVAGKPFIVFHDAYHYFEKRFGMHAVGSITLNPEAMPGARRLADIQQRIRDTGAACVFAEPQFDIGYVKTVIEGTGARESSLDGLGAAIPAGPGAYEALLHSFVTSLTSCLSG